MLEDEIQECQISNAAEDAERVCLLYRNAHFAKKTLHGYVIDVIQW